jgi:hypothetical protein
MMRTTIFGSSILSPPRKNEPRRRSDSRSVASARVSCRRALFRERERDFSPTNQLCTFLFEAFGKKEHPPRHNERNDTSENNNALNNLFSFSHHRKKNALSKKKKKKKKERKRGPGKARVFRAFSHRSKFVEKKKKKRCIRLRRKARKEARIRRRKYTTCTRTFCTKTRRRV